MATEVSTWEDDGGAYAPCRKLDGSTAQVEWAERIRSRVSSEFDRVAAAFHAVAQKQDSALRASTNAVIAILEETRGAVMRNESAGYFIHDWQDIHDQVRKMIFSDPRYQAIRNGRKGSAQPELKSSAQNLVPVEQTVPHSRSVGGQNAGEEGNLT